MAAPLQFRDLVNLDGYEKAVFCQQADRTIARLVKKEGGREYLVTVDLPKSLNENDLRNYLDTKETKEKIEDLVKQFDLCFTSFDKKNNLYIEACGKDLTLFYDRRKGGFRKLNLSGDEFSSTWHNRTDEYKAKAERVKADKVATERNAAHLKRFDDFMKKFKPLLNDKIAPKIPEPRGVNPAIKVEPPAPPPAAPVI